MHSKMQALFLMPLICHLLDMGFVCVLPGVWAVLGRNCVSTLTCCVHVHLSKSTPGTDAQKPD